ncbi:MAG: lipopolysaccharide assembly protein LapA domain-containing protein [Nitrospinota bacterium]|jgi:lipopolysaccharide biosynthesis regulator YciM|nr:lipopolysaccharide assembly protein LapA domain-containing protein [Nitrospinota bacterium]MDP7386795.1 lipopolysaccharide assembly protein LapA domain-containing protein [Nitrospinota bacterium]HJM42942.1 lipopolysaccharide assembly protein LapA domain-containing protein [Nitrospinota bacterium]
MPVRFLLTFVPICAGGLYLLTHESGNVPITLFPGLQAPLAVVVLCSALIGALGTGLSDVPSRLVNHWWQARKLRDARKRQEAETLYQAGLAALSAGDDPRARRSLRQALRKNPGHHAALLESGNLQRRLGNLEAAFDFHRKAVQTGSDDLRLIESLADDFAAAGRPDALRALVERVRHAGGAESIPLARLRDLYVSKGEWETAVRLQTQLMRLPGGDRDGDARMLLANLLYEAGSGNVRSGGTDMGVDQFRKAIRTHGDCVPPRVALGDAHHRSGEREKALRVWREGYERTRAPIFIDRIVSMLNSEDPGEDVIQALHRTLRGHPADERLRLALAGAYLSQDRPADALNALSEPSEMSAPAAKVLRGRARLEMEDVSGARSELAAGPESGSGFQCSACGERMEAWSGRCASCGGWGTVGAA